MSAVETINFTRGVPANESFPTADLAQCAANALATIIGVWDEPQPFFEKARPLLESEEKVRAGVTIVNGVMVARLLGEATQVREAGIRFLSGLRGQKMPRVWHV